MNNEEKILSMMGVMSEKFALLEAMAADMKDVKSRLGNVESKLGNVEREVVKTNISIENDLYPTMCRIADVVSGQIEKVNYIKKSIESMEPTVLALDILHIQEGLKTKASK